MTVAAGGLSRTSNFTISPAPPGVPTPYLDFNLHSGNRYPQAAVAANNRFYVLENHSVYVNSQDRRIYIYNSNGLYLSNLSVSSLNKNVNGLAYYDNHLYLPEATADGGNRPIMRAYDTNGNRQASRDITIQLATPYSDTFSVRVHYDDGRFYLSRNYINNNSLLEAYTTNGAWIKTITNTLGSDITTRGLTSYEGYIYEKTFDLLTPIRVYTTNLVRQTAREFANLPRGLFRSPLFYYNQRFYIMDGTTARAYYVGD